jgi:DNA-binding GntR family transcriptional regulator
MVTGMEEIDRDGAEPLWAQLRDILRAQIAAGEITGRVPSARTLSQRYDLAMVTVAKALQALREEGLITSRQGWGTVVVHGDSPAPDSGESP